MLPKRSRRRAQAPRFAPACLSGLEHGQLQGIRCVLQPEQFNPALHFLAYQTGGVPGLWAEMWLGIAANLSPLTSGSGMGQSHRTGDVAL